MNELIAKALEQHECVLTREGARLVVLLDGKRVRTELGRERTEVPHSSNDAAREAFVARIEQALSEGFGPVHRDPPKAVPLPPREPRAPLPEFAPPALPPRPPPPEEGPDLGPWQVRAPFVNVDLMETTPDDWDRLVAMPPAPGVDHVEVYVQESAADAFALVLEGGVPAWAKGLTLGTFEALEEFADSQLDLTEHWEQLAGLTRLELRAGSVVVPPRSLPALQHLEVWCTRADEALVDALCAQPWPALQSLRLWLMREGEEGLPLGPVLERLTPARFPQLRSLGLHATSGGAGVDVAKHPLAAQLTTLVVDDVFSRGTLEAPDGIELLSTGEFFPLRSGRF